MSGWFRVLCGLVLAGWSTNAAADDYKRVVLTDGRVLTARIVGIDSGQLVLEVPQGHIKIHQSQVQSWGELITEAEYQQQPPWKVLVLPFISETADLLDRAQQIEQEIAEVSIPAISHTEVVTPADLSDALLNTEISALEMCGLDVGCVQPFTQRVDLDLVVMGTIEQRSSGPELILLTNFLKASRAQNQMALSVNQDQPPSPKAIADMITVAMGLEVGTNTPETQTTKTTGGSGSSSASASLGEPKPPGSSTLGWMSWLPVPGITSLAQRDFGGMAMAWGITVPATLAMVGATGHGSPRAGQFFLLSAASYYAITVSVNRGIGLRRLETLNVSALPVEDGGFVVQIGTGPGTPPSP